MTRKLRFFKYLKMLYTRLFRLWNDCKLQFYACFLCCRRVRRCSSICQNGFAAANCARWRRRATSWKSSRRRSRPRWAVMIASSCSFCERGWGESDFARFGLYVKLDCIWSWSRVKKLFLVLRCSKQIHETILSRFDVSMKSERLTIRLNRARAIGEISLIILTNLLDE